MAEEWRSHGMQERMPITDGKRIYGYADVNIWHLEDCEGCGQCTELLEHYQACEGCGHWGMKDVDSWNLIDGMPFCDSCYEMME